jgi:hypothetical protein
MEILCCELKKRNGQAVAPAETGCYAVLDAVVLA